MTASFATGGISLGRSWEANGIVIDSRKVNPGNLFVAIKGNRFDGHDFTADAFDRGAAAAMVEQHPPLVPEDAPLLRVPDSLKALRNLGVDVRARSQASVVAVTGSVGKTGTKDLMAAALGAFGKTYSTPGNLNNQIGAPLSLSCMPRDAEFGVFEIGMNHAGEIDGLSRLIRPNAAIITNIGPVHIGHFTDEMQIAHAKSEIFEGLDPGGIVILNRDNIWFDLLNDKAIKSSPNRIITFGFHESSDVQLAKIEVDHFGSSVEVIVEGQKLKYPMNAVGKHWAVNSAGVLACVYGFNLDIKKAAKALKSITAGPGRGKKSIYTLPDGGIIQLIDESYNASPPSMFAAFSILRLSKPTSDGRRIAILGEMLELGANGPQLHAALAGPLLESRPDKVFTVGNLMQELSAALPNQIRGRHSETSVELANTILNELRAGDVVLVKGSLGTKMSSIVDAIHSMAEAGKQHSSKVLYGD